MDKCIAGHFRAGMFRCNVYVPLFDELLEQFKNISLSADAAVFDFARFDYSWLDVYVELFEEIMKQFENV